MKVTSKRTKLKPSGKRKRTKSAARKVKAQIKSNYIIRKAIKNKSSIVINIPKSICQKLDLFGANVKMIVVAKTLIISKIKEK
jgi:hypothetical protein